MLLVVGPSGSGKTTLIQRLQAGQPLQQLHTTVPTVGSNIVDLKIGLAKKTAVTVRELGEWHDDVAHHHSCIHLFIYSLGIYSFIHWAMPSLSQYSSNHSYSFIHSFMSVVPICLTNQILFRIFSFQSFIPSHSFIFVFRVRYINFMRHHQAFVHLLSFFFI